MLFSKAFARAPLAKVARAAVMGTPVRAEARFLRRKATAAFGGRTAATAAAATVARAAALRAPKRAPWAPLVQRAYSSGFAAPYLRNCAARAVLVRRGLRRAAQQQQQQQQQQQRRLLSTDAGKQVKRTKSIPGGAKGVGAGGIVLLGLGGAAFVLYWAGIDIEELLIVLGLKGKKLTEEEQVSG